MDVLAGLVDESTWEFKGARLGDRGVDLNFVKPGLEVSPLPGDVIELGVQISNSETGFGGAKGSLFALRLVCLNGAVISDKLGSARWNYDLRSISHECAKIPRRFARAQRKRFLAESGLRPSFTT